MYCSNDTEVTNSRSKARMPLVWRRRACKACDAQFTTHETPDYTSALVVRGLDGNKLYPFSRDKLFLSLYQSLGHRKDALNSSTALTSTVIGRLINKKYRTTRSKVHTAPTSSDESRNAFSDVNVSLDMPPSEKNTPTSPMNEVGIDVTLQRLVTDGVIDTQAISKVAHEVLKRFDPLAATTYKAYHQAALK